MTVLAILVGLLLLILLSMIVVILRMGALNLDPLQDTLAKLIEELVRDDFSESAVERFTELASAHIYRYRVEGHYRMRMSHALALLNNRLPKYDYLRAERFIRSWKLGRFHASLSGVEPLVPDDTVPDVFLSYAREDHDAIRVIAAAMRSNGLRVWWDDGIEVGAKWEADIKWRLDSAKVVVVFWSPFASVSDWVRREAAIARQQNKLVPVLIRQCPIPGDFADMHAVDLIDWGGEADYLNWMRLIASIKRAVAMNIGEC